MEKKYFAVTQGWRPGVYDTVMRAQVQLCRYPRGHMKSFNDPEKAYEYLADHGVQEEILEEIYYVVIKGHAPGIYLDCEEFFQQIEDFPGAKYRIFDNLQAATQCFKASQETCSAQNPKKKINQVAAIITLDKTSPVGYRCLPEDLTPYDLVIYTDGSCHQEYTGNTNELKNYGGFGFTFFYQGELVLKIKTTPNARPNEMELAAITYALEYLYHERIYVEHILIATDCTAALRTIEKLSEMSDTRNDLDFFQCPYTYQLLFFLTKFPSIEFVWTKAHADCPGNCHIDEQLNFAIEKAYHKYLHSMNTAI